MPLASDTLFTQSECQTTLLCSVEENPRNIVNETTLPGQCKASASTAVERIFINVILAILQFLSTSLLCDCLYDYWLTDFKPQQHAFVIHHLCLLLKDGQSRTVRQFQFTDWPEQGVPKSGEGFIDFIGQVHKTKEQFGQDGPISVHCR